MDRIFRPRLKKRCRLLFFCFALFWMWFWSGMTWQDTASRCSFRKKILKHKEILCHRQNTTTRKRAAFLLLHSELIYSSTCTFYMRESLTWHDDPLVSGQHTHQGQKSYDWKSCRDGKYNFFPLFHIKFSDTKLKWPTYETYKPADWVKNFTIFLYVTHSRHM